MYTHTQTGLLLCGSHKAGLSNCKQRQIHTNTRVRIRIKSFIPTAI